MNEPTLAWDDVRLFLAIARAGTLSAAAPTLGLSQPTAGRRLRALEDAVGVALFQRTTQGLRLTDTGEAMLVHAQSMEEQALALERRLVGDGSSVEGSLRISASEWFARHVLAPLVADFTIRCPAIMIEIVADTRPLDLDKRETDIAFRFGEFRSADVVQSQLTTIRHGLYAGKGYLAGKKPLVASGGEGHAIITMDRAFDHLLDVVWLRTLLPKARVSVRANTRDVQAEACVRNAGLAVLPRIVGDALSLERIRLEEDPPLRGVSVGYHRDLKRLGRLRAFLDHVRAATPKTI